MSTLKVLPLVGVLAFLVIPVGWPRKARTIAAAVVAFAALHLINAVISGSYTVSLVKATLGQIPHQPALFSESGGLNNPNFIDFVFALFHTFNVDKATLVSSALAFCFLILGVVIAMLAGDEVAPEDPITLRATGFLARNWETFNRNKWLDTTIEHTSRAFLGVTMQCARCHDHKFDAIPTKDYYALVGYLKSSRYQQAFIDPPEQRSAKLDELASLQATIRETVSADVVPLWMAELQNARLYLLAAATKEKEASLDAARLQKWLKALQQIDATDTSHPLHAWVKQMATGHDRESRAQLLTVLAAAGAKASQSGAAVSTFEDFKHDSFAGFGLDLRVTAGFIHEFHETVLRVGSFQHVDENVGGAGDGTLGQPSAEIPDIRREGNDAWPRNALHGNGLVFGDDPEALVQVDLVPSQVAEFLGQLGLERVQLFPNTRQWWAAVPEGIRRGCQLRRVEPRGATAPRSRRWRRIRSTSRSRSRSASSRRSCRSIFRCFSWRGRWRRPSPPGTRSSASRRTRIRSRACGWRGASMACRRAWST
jgi:hypothetical protein